MERDVFKAGTSPGSPTSATEIKTLICYILSQIKESMSFSQLHEAAAEHGLVNYFDLVSVLDQLVETGHLDRKRKEGEADRFAITPPGERIAGELGDGLPLSVREKAVRAAELTLGRERRLSELTVTQEPAGGGYLLHLAIPDVAGTGAGEPDASGTLLSLSVFAPNGEQRDLMKRRFLNDPQFIYQVVTALLTGDRRVLDQVVPQDPLF